MKNFITFVAKSLVDNPENLSIKEDCTNEGHVLELHAPQNEIGKIIGKHGHMADAMRNLTNFYATTILKKPLTLRIIDNSKES